MTTTKSRTISRQQRYVRAFILIFGTLIFCAFLFLDPLLRHMRKSDFKDAPLQEGTATVVTLVLPPPNFLGDPRGDQQRPLVGVRFRGNIYNVGHVYAATQLQIGKEALIEYRVGKSGRVAVESVSPIH